MLSSVSRNVQWRFNISAQRSRNISQATKSDMLAWRRDIEQRQGLSFNIAAASAKDVAMEEKARNEFKAASLERFIDF